MKVKFMDRHMTEKLNKQENRFRENQTNESLKRSLTPEKMKDCPR